MRGPLLARMVYFFSFFSPADLIFSSSACIRKFILFSFANAQFSISPLTDYTSRFRSLTKFAIPYKPIRRLPDCQFIARSLDRLLALSLDRSVDRSVAQSLAPSLGLSFGRSVSRSVHLPSSLSPSPYLVFPTLSPAYLTLRPPHLDLLIGTKHLSHIRFLYYRVVSGC
jgi:hypothetical protein